MADLKISQLSDGGASQATDEYVVARSGANYRIDGASVAAAATSVGTLTSLTVSGDLTVDTSTLKVDSTNNRVGIGTTSPVGPLDVADGTNPIITIRNTAQKNWNTGDAIGYLDYRIDDTSASGAKTVAYVRSLVDTGVSNGVTVASNLIFGTGAYDAAASEKMRLDASGNLGLGVTPSAWADYKALQTTGAAFIGYSDGSSNNQAILAANAFFTTGSVWKYINTDNASYYRQYDGTHAWFNAPSGTAGNAITFTQAMTLDASGNLLVGDTSVGGYGPLQIGNTSSALTVLQLLSSTSGVCGIQFGDAKSGNAQFDGYIAYDQTSRVMVFATAQTERARITSGGYFKASDDGTYYNSAGTYHELRATTNNPAAILTSVNASFTGNALEILTNRNTTNNTYYYLACYDLASSSFRLRIADSGNVTNVNGSYGTISDARHKQDIVDAPSQWNDLKAFKFRKFRMKSQVEADENAPYLLGVVAQELEEVSPGLVSDEPDYEDREVTDEDGNVTTERVQVGTTKTVKSSILLMKAAVALQEAMARIEALEASNAGLMARLEALEA